MAVALPGEAPRGGRLTRARVTLSGGVSTAVYVAAYPERTTELRVAVLRKPGAAWVGAASDVGTRASTVQFPPPNPISKLWGGIRQVVVRVT